MSDDDEYSTHQEFSSSAMAIDELHVQQIFASISRHGNTFDLGSSSVRNLVTCSEVDSKLLAFLLKVNEVGDIAYNGFSTSRLLEKSAKFFDTIKTWLAYEIGSIPYYLFKNSHLLKAKKIDLRNALRKTKLVVVIVDFMGHAIKLPIKELNNLRTYHDLASHLWNTFIQIY